MTSCREASGKVPSRRSNNCFAERHCRQEKTGHRWLSKRDQGEEDAVRTIFVLWCREAQECEKNNANSNRRCRCESTHCSFASLFTRQLQEANHRLPGSEWPLRLLIRCSASASTVAAPSRIYTPSCRRYAHLLQSWLVCLMNSLLLAFLQSPSNPPFCVLKVLSVDKGTLLFAHKRLFLSSHIRSSTSALR